MLKVNWPMFFTPLTRKDVPQAHCDFNPPGLIAGTSLTRGMGFFDRTLIKVVNLHLPRITLHEGAYKTLWAATSKEEGPQSGGIYEPVGKVIEGTKLSEDERLEKELWDWTEEDLGVYC
jgi:hypothetical protein